MGPVVESSVWPPLTKMASRDLCWLVTRYPRSMRIIKDNDRSLPASLDFVQISALIFVPPFHLCMCNKWQWHLMTRLWLYFITDHLWLWSLCFVSRRSVSNSSALESLCMWKFTLSHFWSGHGKKQWEPSNKQTLLKTRKKREKYIDNNWKKTLVFKHNRVLSLPIH